MKRSVKTAIIIAILTSNLGAVYAQEYTVKLGGKGVWNGTWVRSDGTEVSAGDAGFPVSKTTVAGMDVYTFEGGSSYINNQTVATTVINANGNNPIKIQSSNGQGIVFDGWRPLDVGAFLSTNNIEFGDNITIKNTSGKGGGSVGGAVHSEGSVKFGNNAKLVDNVFGNDAYGGAAVGIMKTSAGERSIVFGDNAIVSGNKIISASEGYGGAIHNPFGAVVFGNNVTLSNNMIINQGSAAGYGGAVLVYGDLIIGADNTSMSTISNNTAEGIKGYGGAIYAAKNVIFTGSVDITGNTASGYGGALFLNAPGNKIQFQLAAGNTVNFRDNKAGVDSGSNAIYMGADNVLEINYSGGGTVNFYDSWRIAASASKPAGSFVQNGNGITNIWDVSSIAGSTNINGGTLALQAAVTMPNTTDGALTTYPAGKLITDSFTMASSGKFEAYDGAILESGSVNFGDNTVINFYGSGAINPVSNGDFVEFSASAPLTLGSNSLVNMAATSADGQVNKRGTEFGKFTALHVNAMGNNNTFTLNSDVANNIADKIVVGSTTAGTNYIKIGYDPTIFAGGNVDSATKTLVVEAAGATSGALQGTFSGAASDIGVYSYTPSVIQEGDNWYITGKNATPAKPSRTVEGMTSALMSSFRLVNNDLLKRMGELRFNPHDAGVWMRMYTGESDIKGGGNQRYTVVQGGIDKARQEKDGVRFTGIALENIYASNAFNTGKGNTSLLDIAAYQSWLGKKGHYYDVVGKIYRISNSMDVVDTEGKAVNGDYNNWGYGLSWEYGYRQELSKGYFLIPQVELTYRYIMGADYTTSNSISVKQGGYSSLVGRAGLTLGRKYNNNSQIYITGNILREFAANAKLSASDPFNNSINQTISGKETWYNIAIGATFKSSKKNDWYRACEKKSVKINPSMIK